MKKGSRDSELSKGKETTAVAQKEADPKSLREVIRQSLLRSLSQVTIKNCSSLCTIDALIFMS